jgi:acetyl-CoA carboxylase biotin carboxyl carrier protein
LLDIDRIRKLVDMMVTNDLVELSLRDGDVEVNLRRPTAVAEVMPVVNGAPTMIQSVPDAAAVLAPEGSIVTEDLKLTAIHSPMVGSFYAAADPESAPFIHVGSRVNIDTVVCIVEAMKVFNEIKAEMSGTIEEILVKNGEAVEYGQPLFSVRCD